MNRLSRLRRQPRCRADDRRAHPRGDASAAGLFVRPWPVGVSRL